MIYQPMPLLRKCSKCGAWKPLNRYFFFKQTTGPDGFKRLCRGCCGALKPPQKAKFVLKQCTKCKQWKSATPEFFKIRKLRDGSTSLRGECHDCRLAERRNRYAQNPDLHLKKERQRYARSIDKMRAQNRAKRQKSPVVYQDIGRRGSQKRRARRLAVADTFTSADWQRAIDYFHGVCAYCSNPPSFFDKNWVLHQEHFIPISKGGAYTPENIIPACQQCNFDKKARDPKKWILRRFGPQKANKILARIEAYFDWVRRHDTHAKISEQDTNVIR